MAATIETMCMIFVAVYLVGSIIHRYYLAAALEKTKTALNEAETKIRLADREKKLDELEAAIDKLVGKVGTLESQFSNLEVRAELRKEAEQNDGII